MASKIKNIRKASSGASMASAVTKIKDHRVRVAKDRRDKMRARLLKAVMASYAHRGWQIDDVIKEAKVSRATFYKYFKSPDGALDALGQQLQDELRENIGTLIDDSDHAVQRIAAGVQVFLLRGVTDPTWAGFVTRTSYVARDAIWREMIVADLSAARDQGEIEFEDVNAASSLLLGTLMEAIQYLSFSGKRKRGYVEDLSVMILRGLGVAPERARKVVRERAIYVRGLAPDRLPWWRDPWL
jgi:AcrR family transcriptional regulator